MVPVTPELAKYSAAMISRNVKRRPKPTIKLGNRWKIVNVNPDAQ
jgi:hypothetical protein